MPGALFGVPSIISRMTPSPCSLTRHAERRVPSADDLDDAAQKIVKAVKGSN